MNLPDHRSVLTDPEVNPTRLRAKKAKKQKGDDDKEEEEMKKHMEIVQDGPERPRVYSDLSPEDKDRHMGHCEDVTYKVSELTKEVRESQLYDDFEHFRQHKGETIHDYYVRSPSISGATTATVDKTTLLKKSNPVYDEADPSYDSDILFEVKIAPPDYSKENYLATFTPQQQLTPEQIFWSQDIIKMKGKALKEQTSASRPTKALTVYPPNMPATLVLSLPFHQTLQESLEYMIGTCPKALNTQDNKHASTSLPKKKKVTFEEQCAMSKSNTHKPVEQLNCQKTNVPVPPSTGVNSCTNASKSQPRSNTKKNRILPAKSVNIKKVEEHPRTIKSSLKTTNRVDF
ncbi:hypothetical protein Tco_0117143 [Tanacetum coccineum]